MSKTALKKELAAMGKDQLTEIILSAYSVSKETKEYFDFFLNPDSKVLLDKYVQMLVKEFSRTKFGRRSKSRISVVKKHIKKFISFQPGSEYVLELYGIVVKTFVAKEKDIFFAPAFYKGMEKIFLDFIMFADKNECLDKVLVELDEMMERKSVSKVARNLIENTVKVYSSGSLSRR